MINIHKLKAKIKEKNMTQEELAKRIGIDSSTLSKRMNDLQGNNFTIEEATKMIEILSISGDEVTQIFFNNNLRIIKELKSANTQAKGGVWKN